jgi:hypothetical protein
VAPAGASHACVVLLPAVTVVLPALRVAACCLQLEEEHAETVNAMCLKCLVWKFSRARAYAMQP